MNKTAFINELSIALSYPEDKCIMINEILESNFFISKKNKDIIIEKLVQTLKVTNDEGTHIYDIAVRIIKDEVKNKLKHPFRNNG